MYFINFFTFIYLFSFSVQLYLVQGSLLLQRQLKKVNINLIKLMINGIKLL